MIPDEYWPRDQFERGFDLIVDVTEPVKTTLLFRWKEYPSCELECLVEKIEMQMTTDRPEPPITRIPAYYDNSENSPEDSLDGLPSNIVLNLMSAGAISERTALELIMGKDTAEQFLARAKTLQARIDLEAEHGKESRSINI